MGTLPLMYTLDSYGVKRLQEVAPHPVLTTSLTLHVGDDGRHHGIVDDEGPTTPVEVRPLDVKLCTCWDRAVHDPTSRAYLLEAGDALRWEEIIEAATTSVHDEMTLASLATWGTRRYLFGVLDAMTSPAVPHLTEWKAALQRRQDRVVATFTARASSTEAHSLVGAAALRYGTPDPTWHLVIGGENAMGFEDEDLCEFVGAVLFTCTLKTSKVSRVPLMKVSGTVLNALQDNKQAFILHDSYPLPADPQVVQTVIDLYTPDDPILGNLQKVVTAAENVHAR